MGAAPPSLTANTLPLCLPPPHRQKTVLNNSCYV